MSKKTVIAGSEIREKRKFWQAQVKDWKESSLTQAEYCRRQGLKAHRLGYWVNKPSTESVPSNQPLALVEIPIQKIPVCGNAALKLTIDNRYQVEISDNFTPTTLEQVLLVLRRVA